LPELTFVPILSQMTFSPDGRRVIGLALDHTVSVWDLEPLRLVSAWPNPPGTFVLAKALSVDGRYALVAGHGGAQDRRGVPIGYNVRLLDAENGHELASFAGHTQTVRCVAFAPDGRSAASGAQDRTIRLWDLSKHVGPGRPVRKAEPIAGEPVKPQRVAVPSVEDQQIAERLVKQAFQAEYARRSAADKAALASKLLDKARETNNDPAARYVLLREARDLAAQAGDVAIALAAVDELVKLYEVNEVETRVGALTAALKTATTPAANKLLLDAYLAVIDRVLADEKFDLADELLTQAETAARRTQSTPLVTLVQARRKEIPDYRKDAAAAAAALEALKKDPNDAEANLIAGKYLCFRKGDWEKGLPLLAKGSDAALAALARKDLAAAADASAQVPAADGWWDRAEAEKGWEKKPEQQRAAYWYKQALPGLQGIAQAKAETRLKQATEPAQARLPAIVGERHRLTGHADRIVSVSLSRDGSRLLSASADGDVRLWDADNGNQLFRFDLRGGVRAGALGPDAQYAAAVTEHAIELWDAKSGRRLSGFPAFQPEFLSFADNRSLVVGSGNSVTTWAIAEGGLRVGGTNTGLGFSKVQCLAVSGDGNWLAYVTEDGVLHVRSQMLRRETGKVRTPGTVLCLALSSDGRHLVTAHPDRALRMWNLATLAETRVLRGHTAQVTCLAYSADGRRILSGSDDRTVRLWNAQSSYEIKRFVGHTDKITSVAISGDGRRAASASDDHTVRIWNLPN
jgi:WD40 repeat protein